MGNTSILWDERFTYHEMGYMHPETPRRLLAIKKILDGSGVGRELAHIESRAASDEELAYCHDEKYIRRIRETAGHPLTALDPDTSANAYTWEAARYAAGGFIKCVEGVYEKTTKNAFGFVRPPGHHAEYGHAMGFCFFNNVAIAAEWLIRVKGLSKVAIIDFDVHHCNGTQHAFYKRPDVFVASMHRFPFYPGTGAKDEIGEGDGRGTTLNVPLHANADDDDHLRAIEDVILPAVVKFKPEFLLISAGFDSHIDDPLGGMRVTTGCYRWMMERFLEVASECSEGRLAAVLEGGYNIKALQDSVEAQLEAMTG